MLTIYLPLPDSSLEGEIDRGSGVVGASDGEEATIFYEGNLYGAANIKNFADRVHIAADRSLHHAATVARALVDEKELLEIGFWDDNAGRAVILPECLGDLADWLDVESVPPSELEATAGHYVERRQIKAALASPDPVVRAQAKAVTRARAASPEIDSL
jgi:hypothetical protein